MKGRKYRILINLQSHIKCCCDNYHNLFTDAAAESIIRLIYRNIYYVSETDVFLSGCTEKRGSSTVESIVKNVELLTMCEKGSDS